jgi:hypothetical protein
MFGRYGNQDDVPVRDGGSGMRNEGAQSSRTPNPASRIPLTWPLAVALSETHAYVADTLSRRVVKVKLAWAAEEAIAAP